MTFTRFAKYFLVAITALSPAVAMADDLALVITNGNYGSGVATRPVTLRHDGLVAAYEEQGYEVIAGKNLAAEDMRDLVASFIDRAEDKDRLVIHFSGRVAHFGQEAWMLPIDVDGDSLSETAFQSIPLNFTLSLLAERPGRSALFAALYNSSDLEPPLEIGLGDIDIPQGVLLITGAEGEVNDVILLGLLASEAPVAEVLAGNEDVRIAGFVSPNMSFTTPVAERPAEPVVEQVPQANVSQDYLQNLIEQNTYWNIAVQSNLIADYQEYLRRFPTGLFADAARAKVAELDVPPPPPPAEIESDLNLSRNSRRTIQGNLTLLGYDTRGVDGIFGPGTRAAIEAWQRAQRLDVTGYLDADQIRLMQQQADTRRLEQERADRDYWDATGDSGRKTDLQLYLDRYPEGIYADEARAKLRTIEREEREQADRDAWDRADEIDSFSSYRDYLRDFPEGIYAEVARARLDAMTPPETDPAPAEEETDDSDARNTEARLNLNSATRLLIEGRLRGLGFNPGPVDGRFDGATRNAIRAYQASRGLPVTGYLNASTVQALLLG